MKEKLQSPFIIHHIEGASLQSQIEEALAHGCRRIILEGKFLSTHNAQFSLITIGEGAEVIINGCNFSQNKALICGGAISNLGGYLNISHCNFVNNTCGDTGAAIDNLSSGSLAIIKNCQFSQNVANLIGNGNYGVISSFPDTFLFIEGCNFVGQTDTAIDWVSATHVFEQNNLFNPDVDHPLVVNPTHSNGVFKKISQAYWKLLISQFGLLNKTEWVPATSAQTHDQHQAIFSKLIRQ